MSLVVFAACFAFLGGGVGLCIGFLIGRVLTRADLNLQLDQEAKRIALELLERK